MTQNKPEIALINYGVGNLLSVWRAIEAVGAKCTIIETPEEIAAAQSIILPGVGAFRHCMNELDRRGLIQAILQYAKDRKPLLGICVGMQLLHDSSEEDGLTQGLGLIPGKVIPLSIENDPLLTKKIPHIGWTSLNTKDPSKTFEEDELFHDFKTSNSNVYFVHSFKAVTMDNAHTTAVCDYQGEEICAAVQSGNIYGLQFHPEKSAETGLNILKNFTQL